MTKHNPVGWFEIYVDDLDRATKFYETVFATKLEALPMPEGSEGLKMMSFPMESTAAGASGALVKMDGAKAGGNSTMVYFSCEDCATEESRIEAAGGKVHQAKMNIGEYGFVTMAFDTEGNMFGLHSGK
jgi:predicted enzyme related to lactoylglutathione lyase